MAIRYALLGLLSWRPATGYDLKKMIAESSFLYWSGNNNQIYTTLVELHHEGLVSNEVQQQEHYPARKVYTITEKGQAELRQWVQAAPELPQLRSSFLIQLAWADQLAPGELDTLLAKYEYEVQMQVLMLQEKSGAACSTRPAASASCTCGSRSTRTSSPAMSMSWPGCGN